ncbi:MAG: phosphoglycerate kinase [Erysipelotrichaceae bacterium]|jgi:phosphoglycerate kinase|nr:phosphoglycerate kinase [Bacillota bacterium]MDY0118782.1 phosphoglycerate kinase [Bacilli bacterium]NLJ32529.1 phosphoglycerate kinase [Erysipelotrichaceae bacterium]
MKRLKDLNIKNKTVLVRCDFNVPRKGDVITDDNRIVQALPTIKYLLSGGAKVILFSHLGKIKHKLSEEEVEAAKKKNNMLPVFLRLQELLGSDKVTFSDKTRGDKVRKLVDLIQPGEVLLLQNTRYEKGEEKNDPELAKEWASYADAYVMDAFGSAHRAHASTYGVPEILKAEGKEVALGYLVEKEVENLSRCVNVEKADRPYVAILGGFKVSDKIKVIDSLLKKCDKILIGGAMAYTFKKALGEPIGISPVEDDQLEYAKKCFEDAKGRIVLPVDSVVTDAFEGWTKKEVVKDIPEGMEGMDIGPKTIKLFTKELKGAKMVFWNGPMGVFEQKDFQAGTIGVCKAITELEGCFSVIGGGDSAAAAAEFGYKDKFSHVSTGGGASLEMIENDGHLPGIDVIG